MQSGEPVYVACVDVGAPVDESDDLVLVRGGAGGQEHTAIGKLDPPRFALGLCGFSARLTFLPALQLFGAFEQRRVGSALDRRHGGGTLD